MPQENALKNLKIAVTGGSGFLGGHFLPLAHAAGAQITCLVRKASANLPDYVRVERGDALDAKAMFNLLKGQDIFVHMASMLFGHGWQDYFQANLGIARNIARAFETLPREQRPKKLVFISSMAASGPSATLPGKRETDPACPVSAYGWSKLCCEQALACISAEDLIILRPPIIYGSGDRGMLPLFKGIARGMGVSPGCFRKFPCSFIHAEDAAQAILLACSLQNDGVYHLNGSHSDMDVFCKTAAKVMNRKCVVMHAPLPLMQISALFCSIGSSLLSDALLLCGRPRPKPPHWNYDKYLEARQTGWLADGRKFAEHTGFIARHDLESGLRETLDGYRSRGWL